MKKKLLALLLAAVLAAGLLPGTAFAADPGDALPDGLSVLSGSEFNVSVTGTQVYAYAYEVAEQVNRLRAGLGLRQLVIDPVLMETAMLRAAECAVYYSHTRPNGTNCFTAFPSRYGISAENIAAGYTTPTDVMTDWINSPTHYDNMTYTGATAIGVGCFYINGTYYWAQSFTGGAYDTGSDRLSDRTATATFPMSGGNFSPMGGTDAVSLRVGESCQLPVYSRNPGFFNSPTALSGVSGAVLSAGTDLVELDGDTLTVTGLSTGSGTVVLSLPGGAELSFTVRVTERFTDVTADDYFFDAVAWAVEKQVTNGTGDGTTFSPGVTCTHGEIITFLWRAAGKPPAGAQDAVTVASWAQDAVNWAYEQDIIGADFQTSAPCTRADTVIYMWKAAGSPSAPPSSFSDVTADMPCAKAVDWALDKGVTTGSGDGTTFSPDVTCDRSQIVTFLYRAYAN